MNRSMRVLHTFIIATVLVIILRAPGFLPPRPGLQSFI